MKDVLSRKNPYLYKAKYVLTSSEIVKGITDAFISSQEETIFGDWLEGLAIFINEKVFGGFKSGIPSIDLEFIKENIRYIVTIKSGPNWGNSSQLKKMASDFLTASRTFRTSGSRVHVIAVNGCCYGSELKEDYGSHLKYCGQSFWEFISGDKELYTKIIEPLGFMARERNDDFQEELARVLNLFTQEFSQTFCKIDGSIDWIKLVEHNSGKKVAKVKVANAVTNRTPPLKARK